MNEPGVRSAAVVCRAAVHSWQDLPLGGGQMAESLSARTSVLPELPQFQRLLASSLDTLGVAWRFGMSKIVCCCTTKNSI